ncbi:MAG: carbohydrate ABC transporter permease [Cellulomonas sp.]
MLIGPAILFSVGFCFVPMAMSLFWSFTSYNGIQSPQLVGVQNYTDLFADPRFIRSLTNTLVFALLTMTVGPVLGLGSALLLNRRIRLQGLFRGVFFLPVTMSLVVVATMWKMLLNDAGLLNRVFLALGLPSHDWLADPSTSLLSVGVASIWQGFGFETVIFLAALQAVSRELYEAASLDGAGPWRSFLAVTLPALRPTVLFVYVIGLIGAFQAFDQVFVMTQGGPLSSTTTVVFYLVDRFRALDLGHASAAAYLLVVFLAALSAVQLRIGRRDS